MEINFEKKRLLINRIKDLESQLEEKSFILTTIKHHEDQTKQTSNPFRKQNNSLLIVNNYIKNTNFPNIINESPKKPDTINNKNPSKTPILKRFLQRATSSGKSPNNQKSCCESDLNETNENSMILLKEYKVKNEQLKLRVKKISERFLSELSNKEKEILDLKKFKNYYTILTEKMKVFKINNKGDSNNDNEKLINNEKSVNSLIVENENLKEELKFMQKTLEEKNSKINVLTKENEKNNDKLEKMANKLKYIMLKKQALEKQMLIFKEKSFQMNLLFKKLENDVNDKKIMISNLKNQWREVGSNAEFENKRPESSKNNLRYEKKTDLNDFENEMKNFNEEKQKKSKVLQLHKEDREIPNHTEEIQRTLSKENIHKNDIIQHEEKLIKEPTLNEVKPIEKDEQFIIKTPNKIKLFQNRNNFLKSVELKTNFPQNPHLHLKKSVETKNQTKNASDETTKKQFLKEIIDDDKILLNLVEDISNKLKYYTDLSETQRKEFLNRLFSKNIITSDFLSQNFANFFLKEESNYLFKNFFENSFQKLNIKPKIFVEFWNNLDEDKIRLQTLNKVFEATIFKNINLKEKAIDLKTSIQTESLFLLLIYKDKCYKIEKNEENILQANKEIHQEEEIQAIYDEEEILIKQKNEINEKNENKKQFKNSKSLFEKEQIDENFSKKKGSLANQYNVQDNKNFEKNNHDFKFIKTPNQKKKSFQNSIENLRNKPQVEVAMFSNSVKYDQDRRNSDKNQIDPMKEELKKKEIKEEVDKVLRNSKKKNYQEDSNNETQENKKIDEGMHKSMEFHNKREIRGGSFHHIHQIPQVAQEDQILLNTSKEKESDENSKNHDFFKENNKNQEKQKECEIIEQQEKNKEFKNYENQHRHIDKYEAQPENKIFCKESKDYKSEEPLQEQMKSNNPFQKHQMKNTNENKDLNNEYKQKIDQINYMNEKINEDNDCEEPIEQNEFHCFEQIEERKNVMKESEKKQENNEHFREIPSTKNILQSMEKKKSNEKQEIDMNRDEEIKTKINEFQEKNNQTAENVIDKHEEEIKDHKTNEEEIKKINDHVTKDEEFQEKSNPYQNLHEKKASKIQENNKVFEFEEEPKIQNENQEKLNANFHEDLEIIEEIKIKHDKGLIKQSNDENNMNLKRKLFDSKENEIENTISFKKLLDKNDEKSREFVNNFNINSNNFKKSNDKSHFYENTNEKHLFVDENITNKRKSIKNIIGNEENLNKIEENYHEEKKIESSQEKFEKNLKETIQNPKQNMITEIIEELEIKIFEMSEFKHQRSVESEKNQVNNNSQEITNYLKSNIHQRKIQEEIKVCEDNEEAFTENFSTGNK